MDKTRLPLFLQSHDMTEQVKVREDGAMAELVISHFIGFFTSDLSRLYCQGRIRQSRCWQ